MTDSTGVDRRTAVKTLGTAIVGGTVLSGTTTASGNVVSQINSHGHWAYFAFGPGRWGRQKHPYDYRDNDSRWMAEPARGGGVRTLAKNITTSNTPSGRNAGFDIHMGPLGDLDEITITSRTVQSQGGTPATLFIGLYLDVDDNGEFFVWENVGGNTDRFAGVGGDEEGTASITASGESIIDENTEFGLLVRGGSKKLGKLQDGVGDIDGGTQTALYIGVVDPGTDGVEEAIIEAVDIDRS